MGNRIFLLPVIGVTAFFILLFSFTKLFGPIPFSVNSVTTTKFTTFDVTGEGKVIVKPDMASVTAGIQSTGSTVKAVQEQINSVINNASDAVKKLGVDDKEIQTTNYSINPTYDYSGGNQKITGYTAAANLLIKVKQIDKINQVIDAATAKGANQISGISFDVLDREKAENEARDKAVKQAKKKATDAAKIAGFRLGKIVNYSENLGDFPIPVMRTMDAKGSPEAPTQIEPGSTDITITITLSYELQ